MGTNIIHYHPVSARTIALWLDQEYRLIGLGYCQGSCPGSAEIIQDDALLTFVNSFIHQNISEDFVVMSWRHVDVINEAIDEYLYDKTQKQLNSNASMEKQEIWIGRMPSAFGYGISVIGFSEKQVRESMRKAYAEFKKAYKPQGKQFSTFNNAMEYFGGDIKTVTPGKAYYEDFGE